MSNFIPFVSSSPPPMDDTDSQSFGWEDEDDFGNFACAPGVKTVVSDIDNAEVSSLGDSNFDVDWSQAGSNVVLSETTETSSSLENMTSASAHGNVQTKTVIEETKRAGTPESVKSLSPSMSGSEFAEEISTNSTCDRVDDSNLNEDDDFADFTAFHDDSGSKHKPSVGSLPLQKTNHRKPETSDACGIDNKEKAVETAMEKSRESTTDSGLFSTDMSPLTKSESFSISEGDRILQSEDETFTDLPHDTDQTSQSSAITTSLVSDPKNELMERKLDASENQTITPSEDSGDMSVLEGGDSSSQCNEASEQGENGVSKENTPSNEKQEGDISSGLWDQTSRQTTFSGISDGIADCTTTEVKTDQNAEAKTATESETEDTSQSYAPEVMIGKESSLKDLPDEEAAEDDGDLSAFQTNHTPPLLDSKRSDSTQGAEPEDLVLRTNSVEFDEDSSEIDNELADMCATINTVESSHTSPSQSAQGNSSTPNEVEDDDEFGNFSEQSFHHKTSSEEVTNKGHNDQAAEKVACSDSFEVDFGTSLSNESDKVTKGSDEVKTDFGDFSSNDDAMNRNEENDLGDFSSKTTTQDETEWDDFGDLSSRNATCVSKDDVDDDFDNFSSQPAPSAAVVENTNTTDLGEFSSNATDVDKDDVDDFGDFNSQPTPSAAVVENSNTADFGAFSSKCTDVGKDDDDDFGDFSSQLASSAAVEEDSNTADFGAFSSNSTDVGKDDGDDFGDFSGQTRTASTAQDSGWANFSGQSNTEAEEDDFGNFSATKEPAGQEILTASDSSAKIQSLQDTVQGKILKFEAALLACFPGYTPTPHTPEEPTGDVTAAENGGSVEDEDKFGRLETILQYGLRFRSASQQTWQVVQHPSKNDSRVKLWNHLKDVDGSPAVVYQWAKSHTNSHLFDTLHIDTQNMLIGHKKVSVPIFATGLSLLEPIRGGGRDNRMLGVGGQPPKGSSAYPTAVSSTLVDPGQQNMEQSAQEIPAVDFDWSTSGLTNPLTSKSLDLDFLVVQDNDASEKLSVFQSEILDAPRSNVKSSQPLEDILKSVKPTSVRSRRDNAATSQMSAEAVRVLAGLPDLSFMHSKVLMFPIKN